MNPQLVVFISGFGANLQALIDGIDAGQLDAEICLVVSNRKQAFGLVRAQQVGIPTLYFPIKPYKEADQSREKYDADLAARVRQETPDLIVLAGWMHILSPAFLRQFPGQVINLHPALPGQFAGTHAIERAFVAYQQGDITGSGCMVHEVVPEVDAGPVIATAAVPILATDTLADFEARMHQAEHELIVRAVRLVLSR
ncbi:MAG: phosphoribosylglycinamide formyltransferase [Chloroflexi bacterium]|nr:phosphoribosylglycinamide formyltransferase [Chloroflexota bacterium]